MIRGPACGSATGADQRSSNRAASGGASLGLIRMASSPVVSGCSMLAGR
ncbi:Uncharacterised protein [Mycobacteroides abscessus subsp. abscessus]|nr:Uncharacterised protein [Mycobacteroides abscessus subsp. abscessus]